MWHTDKRNWSRLDNAAKIFAPTSDHHDTRVFRFACELTEQIDKERLQFPGFRCVMHRGLFWNYLEQSPLRPLVQEETGVLCGPIYDKTKLTLLFRVTYYKTRLNLEMFHVLSDGTGALAFLKTIVYYYLSGDQTAEAPSLPPDFSPVFRKSDDSFNKYYDKTKEKSPIEKRAYKLRGTIPASCRLSVIEGVMSSQRLLELAHQYNTSITALMTAVLMCAIYEEMPVRKRKRPVTISVPVNLRKYFPSETARNFFGMINVSYSFKNQPPDFEHVLAHVTKIFRRELTIERLSIRMNKLIAVEHNFFVRIPPLPIKDFVLKLARMVSDSKVTAVISNVGPVQMPEELSGRIRRFDFCISTRKTQLCICSFRDEMLMSFSSAFEETTLQAGVFRRLREMGVEITIYSNVGN